MSYILAKIVFPSPEWNSYTGLFFHSHIERKIKINGSYINARLYEFNTWMNMFAASKYYKYCDLGELYLQLHVKGSYHLQIVGSNHNYLFGHSDTILVDKYITSDFIEVHVPCSINYKGIYFILFEDEANPVEIVSAAWTTNKAPIRQNKLAIVSCTFKREQFINKTITEYEKFINDNSELKERIKYFIVDNGRTLDIDRSNEKVKIIHNKNAGGAGGFTRGLMEICNLNESLDKSNPYTRVLFMDDDIEIIAESFYRTLLLSDYLKEEWKDSFINGAMINLENKNIFFENIAYQRDFYVVSENNGMDLFNYDNVLIANYHSDKIYSKKDIKVHSAWWYCNFYIDENTKNNLPLPLFYRGDDIEWSWRNFGKHHISLNGICVWHQNFEWRVSLSADMYYMPRNMFFINVLYTENFKEKFERYFINIFEYRLKTYDYIAIDIFLAAMDDILKGSVVFREDPEQQMRRIVQIVEKIQYFDAEKNELDKAKSYYPVSGFKRKIIYKLTKWGRYWFSFLFNKESIALEWFPPVDNFRLRKEVKVYNLLTEKYCIRQFDKKKMMFYEKEFYKRLKEIKISYDNIKKDYKKTFPEYKSFSFWKDYLNLE